METTGKFILLVKLNKLQLYKISVQEWYEFTPYEVCIPKYGVSMPMEKFGSKYFMGTTVSKHTVIFYVKSRYTVINRTEKDVLIFIHIHNSFLFLIILRIVF